jgi:hypothetical protein
VNGKQSPGQNQGLPFADSANCSGQKSKFFPTALWLFYLLLARWRNVAKVAICRSSERYIARNQSRGPAAIESIREVGYFGGETISIRTSFILR